MKASETAILLIEFQKEFCSEDGILYGIVKDQLKDVIPRTAKLVEEARKKGCLIVHIPISFSEDYKELGNPTGILKAVVDSGAFKKGSKGVEWVDELKPAPEDIVVEGKKTIGAFASTNLDFILRSRGIKNVAVTGFITNFCVESTVREAYDRGYNVIVIKDCTVARSEDEQKFAEERIFPAFGEVLTHEEFLNKLE